MAETTNIQWCDSTFNSWVGCTKVGPGCDHCYAEQLMDKRWQKVQWGSGKPRVRTSAANWRQPLLWERKHAEFFAAHGRRQRVFCASLADVFDNEVPIEWFIDLLEVWRVTPHLDKLVLTKRIGNVIKRLREADQYLLEKAPSQWPLPLLAWIQSWLAGEPPSDVWLGATIVNREEMLRDALKLKAVPARVRFWSVEPMLGDLGEIPSTMLPDWGIAGGESGHEARPPHPDWFRSMRDQFAVAGLPFLLKQNGEWAYDDGSGGFDGLTAALRARERGLHRFEDGLEVYRYGTKATGRLLDGVEHNGFPEVL